MMPGKMSGKVTFQNVVQLVRAEVHRGLLEAPVEARPGGPSR